MDRSFLSNETLIAASRNFICIRTATYEDAQEAEFLRNVYSGREGQLENTVFALLSPDGQTNLSRTGRSPQFSYRSPEAMAAAMDVLAFGYQGNPESEITSLPVMKNVRLAVNVAACDGLPLMIVYGKDNEQLRGLEKELVPLAFSEHLCGKFIYVKTTDPKEVQGIAGFNTQEFGFAVVTPDQYGVNAKLQHQWPSAVKPPQLQAGLSAFVNATSKVQKNHNQHVRAGRNDGIYWETEIPVEDKMSQRAMQRRPQRDK